MFSHLAAENAEVRINSSMPNFIIAENGDYFNFLDLQKCSQTFYRDGNHLTDSAQTIFLMPFRMVCSKVYVKISRPFPRYQVSPVVFTFTFIAQFCYCLGKFAGLCRMSFDNRQFTLLPSDIWHNFALSPPQIVLFFYAIYC